MTTVPDKGMHNPAFRCYFHSLVQCLLRIRNFRERVLGEPAPTDAAHKELRRIFQRMLDDKRGAR